MDKINIHIIGVAGTMTAPLAKALQKQGHSITGSDQDKIYPPISDTISSIPLNQPLGKVDLCIVGSSYKNFSQCFTEFEQIRSQNIPYISATEYIAQNLVKDNSIIVAGSYGKTTISAILAHTIPNTNYFFGGQSVDDKPSLAFSDSNWSIVEGDESINGLDNKAKFLYYKTKYVILTSVNWEHKDSYQTEAENLQAYRRLIENIPSDGLLVYNPDDQNIQSLLPICKGETIPYIKKDFSTTLIGKHNQENISAAYTLCHHLGLDFDINGFKGIKRRLEVIGQKNNILIIDDFAQSPERVITALEAVQFSYPNRRTYVYFEPHASFLQHPQSLIGFTKTKEHLHQFILGKIKFSPDKNNRVTATDWRKYLGDKLIYIPLNTDIIEYFHLNLKPGDTLIHFSSGGLDGLNTLKTVYNNI